VPTSAEDRLPAVAGWGIVIEGHKNDLADWSEVMLPPFEPWIVKVRGHHVLRSRMLDALGSPDVVYHCARGMVDRLNGAMAAARGSRALQFNGTIIEFRPDGSTAAIAFASLVAEGRSRATAVGIAVGSNGEEIANTAIESEPQRWVALADEHDLLADALMYLGRGEWFDIYKAIESLNKHCGGKLASRGWIPKSELQRLRQTANSHRHFTKGHHTPPTVPVTLREGQKMVGVMVSRAFEDAKLRTNNVSTRHP
jgi:hypothetical protein